MTTSITDNPLSFTTSAYRPQTRCRSVQRCDSNPKQQYDYHDYPQERRRHPTSAKGMLMSRYERLIPSPAKLHNGRDNNRGLPPTHSHGMVASDKYTTYTPQGHTFKVKDNQPRSLPNTGANDGDAAQRQILSAPGRSGNQNRGNKAPAPPKVDNLVVAPLTKDEGGHLRQRTRRQQVPGKDSHAGVPTPRRNHPDTTRKFASNWADIRTEQQTVGRQQGNTTASNTGDKSPSGRQKKDSSLSPGRNGADTSNSQSSRPAGKQPSSSFNWRPKTPPRGKDAADVPEETLQKDTDRKDKSEGKQSRSFRSPGYRIPPRRSRTRVKMQRMLTKMKLERMRTKTNMSESEDEESDTEKDGKYTIDDAVNVYCMDYLKLQDTSAQESNEGNRDGSPGHEWEKEYKAPDDPRRTIPPWHRQEYILTKREAKKYKEIKSVYGMTDEERKKREEQFYKKMEVMQLQEWSQSHQQYRDQKIQALESKIKQQEQLRDLRQKFDDEQWHRWQTQYVTKRVLEHEHMNREDYGLPEETETTPRNKPKLRSKKPPRQHFETEKQRQLNKNRYHKLFRPAKKAKSSTPPKLPGADNMDVDTSYDHGDLESSNDSRNNENSGRDEDIMADAQRAVDDYTDDDMSDIDSPRHPSQSRHKPVVRIAAPSPNKFKTSPRGSRPANRKSPEKYHMYGPYARQPVRPKQRNNRPQGQVRTKSDTKGPPPQQIRVRPVAVPLRPSVDFRSGISKNSEPRSVDKPQAPSVVFSETDDISDPEFDEDSTKNDDILKPTTPSSKHSESYSDERQTPCSLKSTPSIKTQENIPRKTSFQDNKSDHPTPSNDKPGTFISGSSIRSFKTPHSETTSQSAKNKEHSNATRPGSRSTQKSDEVSMSATSVKPLASRSADSAETRKSPHNSVNGPDRSVKNSASSREPVSAHHTPSPLATGGDISNEGSTSTVDPRNSADSKRPTGKRSSIVPASTLGKEGSRSSGMPSLLGSKSTLPRVEGAGDDKASERNPSEPSIKLRKVPTPPTRKPSPQSNDSKASVVPHASDKAGLDKHPKPNTAKNNSRPSGSSHPNMPTKMTPPTNSRAAAPDTSKKIIPEKETKPSTQKGRKTMPERENKPRERPPLKPLKKENVPPESVKGRRNDPVNDKKSVPRRPGESEVKAQQAPPQEQAPAKSILKKKPKPSRSKGRARTPKEKQPGDKPLLAAEFDRPNVPSHELQEDSDSDEDIFEKARRKYGIVLDSDED